MHPYAPIKMAIKKIACHFHVRAQRVYAAAYDLPCCGIWASSNQYAMAYSFACRGIQASANLYAAAYGLLCCGIQASIYIKMFACCSIQAQKLNFQFRIKTSKNHINLHSSQKNANKYSLEILFREISNHTIIVMKQELWL